MKRTAADGLSRWRSQEERREVNGALDRNATWREVAAIRERHGRTGVSSANVTNYRKSQDRQWRMDAIRRESDLTATIMREYAERGGSPAEAGLLRASEILAEALGGIDASALKAMVSEEPQKIFSAVASLAKVAAMVQRERTEVRDAPAVSTAEPGDPAKAIRDIYGL